jgi:CDP-4-dehydro-6-deoxyglucose reductase
VNTVHCQVSEILPLSSNISAVRLRLPSDQAIHWHAGQYLLLGENQDAAFSIANAASENDNELLLHIRHDDDNQSAVDLMAELSSQSTVATTLPLGTRYIDQPPDRPVWFICGSTGFAPARAMIERLARLQFSLPVRLFRGGRQVDDIYPPQWPDNTLEQLKDFQETIAVNHAPAANQFHGMVHEAALAELAKLQDPSGPLFHIGGSPAMAWAVFDALVAAGVPAANIHSDVFDYAPR